MGKALNIASEVKLVFQELKENPYRKFNLVFALMTIIPFLVFFYLLTTRILTINILVGDIGLVLFISFIIATCGLYIGYSIIKDILTKVIFYAGKAKHSDQLKSTFVATVSHELKNPLSVINTNLYSMLRGIIGQITDEQKKVLELCHNVLERMNRLINDLLDLHKIEAGVVELKRKLCDLSKILERQLSEFEGILNKKRIQLIKEIFGKEKLSVWADEDKIMQVVNNILSNAIKYSPEGSSVSLKLYPADNFVKLECIDTGPGIPPDKLTKIFDKFERVDFAKEGTGLGLAITKDLVEMHKGKIWVESEVGKGSKFIVVLPRDLRQVSR